MDADTNVPDSLFVLVVVDAEKAAEVVDAVNTPEVTTQVPAPEFNRPYPVPLPAVIVPDDIIMVPVELLEIADADPEFADRVAVVILT